MKGKGGSSVKPIWTTKDIEQIGKSFLFARLDTKSLEQVLASGSPATYPKGTIICEQGAPAAYCHLVLGGAVKLSRRSGPDANAVISIQKPGQTLMEGDCFSGGLYSTTAEAISSTRVARFDAARLRRLIGRDPSVALAMLGSASVHLRMLLSQVEKLKTMTAVARLVDFIIDLAGPGTGAKSMSLPYEKQILAAQLGITPESFSRTLRQLRPYGVVIEKDKVTVADIAGLRRLRIQD